MSESTKRDPLGDFLTQYDEYLDGRRSYSDLPWLWDREHGDARADAHATPKRSKLPSKALG